MNIIGVIPVRMASTRFPGKPLAKIYGLPIVGHIYFRSKKNKKLKEVYIATCDQEIGDYADSISAKWVMTKSTHRGASDRVAEAMSKIEKQTKKKVDIVIMIQGDEPMIHPKIIDDVLKPIIKNKDIGVSNAIGIISDHKEFNDPNVVKVVVDKNNFALYFSREPIPSLKKGAEKVAMLKQTGIIAFRREFLLNFDRLSPTPLEKIESVDMLRFLELGYKVKIVVIRLPLYSVDTKKDLLFVEKRMKKDKLMKYYLN